MTNSVKSSTEMNETPRSFIWWYGIFIITIGSILWLLSIFDQLRGSVFDLLTIHDLSELGTVGEMAFLFALGFGSASVIGWGFAILASSLHFTSKTRTYLYYSIVAWFILDSISSIISGFYVNVVSNSIFLISALYVFAKTEIENTSTA